MQFLTSLFRRHIKGLTIGAIIAFLPKAFGWVAEQWFGNRVGEEVDKLLCLITFDVFKAPFVWMATHPIQSVVYTTCALVGLFSIETKIHERRQRDNPDRQSENKKAASDAIPPKLGSVRATASAHTLPVEVTTRNHPGGVLIGVTQSFDTIRCYACTISLLDVRKMDNGQSHTIAALHDKNGTFLFQGVTLTAASNDENLFYKSAREWWLTEGSNSSPRIPYWRVDGGSRGRGIIDLSSRGTWVVSLCITLTHPEKDTLSMNKDVAFLWDGTITPHVVD